MEALQVAGILGSLAGISNNPYDDQMKYLNKIPSTIDPIYRPYSDNNNYVRDNLNDYIGRGNQGGNYLRNLLMRMIDPRQSQGIMSDLTTQFQSSPGYNYRKNEVLEAIKRNYAANGMSGTPAEQYQISKEVGDLADQDFNNYYGRSLDMFNRGFEGLSQQQNLGATVGSNQYSANSNMSNLWAQLLATNLQNQGTTAGQGDSYFNKAFTSLMSFL